MRFVSGPRAARDRLVREPVAYRHVDVLDEDIGDEDIGYEDEDEFLGLAKTEISHVFCASGPDGLGWSSLPQKRFPWGWTVCGTIIFLALLIGGYFYMTFERAVDDHSVTYAVMSLLHENTTTYTTTSTTHTTTTITYTMTNTSTTTSTNTTTTTTAIPLADLSTKIFCIFVIQPPPSYEVEVARYLLKKRLSIFSCPGWRVYSDRWDDPVELGNSTDGGVIETTPIPGPAAYGGMMWGRIPMLFNANVFYRAWRHVVSEGAYLSYAFTVKIDADAVFMPSRLARQLEIAGHFDEPDIDEGKFFLNCPKFNSMQGPLEVFSRAALMNFGLNQHRCYDANYENMPEDISMRMCMELLGTWKLQLFGAVYDTRCPRPGMNWWTDCRKPDYAVFHPMKGLKAWKSCYKKVMVTDSATKAQV